MCELHVQRRLGAILNASTKTIKMPKIKKATVPEGSILNYSRYKYSDTLNHFSKHDRLLGKGLSSLEFYSEYQIEKPLNSFDDKALNDHLYRVYYTKKN